MLSALTYPSHHSESLFSSSDNDLSPILPSQSQFEAAPPMGRSSSCKTSHSSPFKNEELLPKIHPSIYKASTLYTHSFLPIPGPISSAAIITDPIKLAVMMGEIPYCLYRTYAVLRNLISANDIASLRGWGSCIVYLTSFCSRIAHENPGWFALSTPALYSRTTEAENMLLNVPSRFEDVYTSSSRTLLHPSQGFSPSGTVVERVPSHISPVSLFDEVFPHVREQEVLRGKSLAQLTPRKRSLHSEVPYSSHFTCPSWMKSNSFDGFRLTLNDENSSIGEDIVRIVQNIARLWRTHTTPRPEIDFCEGARGIYTVPGLRLDSGLLSAVQETPQMMEWTEREGRRGKASWWSDLTLAVTLQWCVDRNPDALLRACVMEVRSMPLTIAWLATKKVPKKGRGGLKTAAGSISAYKTVSKSTNNVTNIAVGNIIDNVIDNTIIKTNDNESTPQATKVKTTVIENAYENENKTQNEDINARDEALFSPIRRLFFSHEPSIPTRFTAANSAPHSFLDEAGEGLVPLHSLQSLWSPLAECGALGPASSSYYPLPSMTVGKYSTVTPATERRIYCLTHVVLVLSEFGSRPILPSQCPRDELEFMANALATWLVEIQCFYPTAHALNREIVTEVAVCVLICKQNGITFTSKTLAATKETIELCLEDHVCRSGTDALRFASPDAKESVYVPFISINQSRDKKGAMFADYHTHFLVALLFQLAVIDTFGGCGLTNHPVSREPRKEKTHENPKKTEFREINESYHPSKTCRVSTAFSHAGSEVKLGFEKQVENAYFSSLLNTMRKTTDSNSQPGAAPPSSSIEHMKKDSNILRGTSSFSLVHWNADITGKMTTPVLKDDIGVDSNTRGMTCKLVDDEKEEFLHVLREVTPVCSYSHELFRSRGRFEVLLRPEHTPSEIDLFLRSCVTTQYIFNEEYGPFKHPVEWRWKITDDDTISRRRPWWTMSSNAPERLRQSTLHNTVSPISTKTRRMDGKRSVDVVSFGLCEENNDNEEIGDDQKQENQTKKQLEEREEIGEKGGRNGAAEAIELLPVTTSLSGFHFPDSSETTSKKIINVKAKNETTKTQIASKTDCTKFSVALDSDSSQGGSRYGLRKRRRLESAVVELM